MSIKRLKKQEAVAVSETVGILKSMKSTLNPLMYNVNDIATVSAEPNFNLFYNPEPLLIAKVDFDNIDNNSKWLLHRILSGVETKISARIAKGFAEAAEFVKTLSDFQLTNINKIVI